MSIRQRLRPDQDSAVWLAKHCSDSRFVYNLGLEQRNLWQRHRVARINTATQMKELAEARQANDWLKSGSSSVQQAALRDLDRAFQNWWKVPQHFAHPTWRRAGVHEGFYVRDLSVRHINRRWGDVFIPKAGWVRFRATRSWADIEAATSARVTLDRSGRWHVSFTTPAPTVPREPTGAVVGLDMGIAATVTTSDGAQLRMPTGLSPGETQRKRRLQRQLSRQLKGSKRRARTKICIAKLAAKEADRRRNWIEQTTTRLVRTYDFIAIEDLAVKNMVRSTKGSVDRPGRNVRQKASLNRSIHGQAWSLFRTRLTDKSTHTAGLDGVPRPGRLVAVNPAYTSQRCSDCGYTAVENRESQAIFRCRACGHTANADVNAACNILAAGLAVSGHGGTSHAPPVPDRDPVDQAQRPDETSTAPNPVAA